jgi:hypothetical protein
MRKRELQREKAAVESPGIEEKKLGDYRSPLVITYSGDDLLEELGPAQTCSPFAP